MRVLQREPGGVKCSFSHSLWQVNLFLLCSQNNWSFFSLHLLLCSLKLFQGLVYLSVCCMTLDIWWDCLALQASSPQAGVRLVCKQNCMEHFLQQKKTQFFCLLMNNCFEEHVVICWKCFCASENVYLGCLPGLSAKMLMPFYEMILSFEVG